MAAMQLNDTEEIQARFADIMRGINLPEGRPMDPPQASQSESLDAERRGVIPSSEPVMGSWTRGRARSASRQDGMEVTFGASPARAAPAFTPAPGPTSQVPLSQERIASQPGSHPVLQPTPYTETLPVKPSSGPIYGALPGNDSPGLKGSALVMRSRINIVEAFPQFFTIFLFGVFAMPLYLCYHIGSNASVEFWIGDYILWTLLLPALYLFTHIVHMISGMPSKPLVLLSLLGSCVMILVMADMVLMDAETKANQFVADDCDTFSGKRELQTQWDAARFFYANCAAERAEATRISFEESVMVYRIEDCPDYENELEHHPDWNYLRDLEVNQNCAGWCEQAEELWTHSIVKDSCSMVVANIMTNEVQYCAKQVVAYTIVVLLFSAIMLTYLGPRLRKSGVAW